MCFAVHKLAKFSSNTGEVHFEGLVHLSRYIRDNKNLGIIYYSKIEDASLYEIMRYDKNNTKKQFMVFSDSIWQNCLDTGISTGAYFVFDQGGLIGHLTHVICSVYQSSYESEYNAA